MIVQADARFVPLINQSVQCVVTSPPYWGLRDYATPPSIWGGDPAHAHVFSYIVRRGHSGGDSEKQLSNKGSYFQQQQQRCSCGAWVGCLGLEPTPDQYVANLIEVFREARRVLRDDGTVWLNLGDSYGGSPPCRTSADAFSDKWNPADSAGNGGLRRSAARSGLLKPKDLVGIPWRVAFALQAEGWYLRSDIIWAKPNPMPESVTDRPTKSHEYLFLLTKREKYYYDQAAIYEPYAESTLREVEDGYEGLGLKDYEGVGVQNPSGVKRRIIESVRKRGPMVIFGATSSMSHRQARAFKSKPSGNEANPNPVELNPYGRNKRTVWTIPTQPVTEAHFATFPEALVEPCILAGSRPNDLVLDPFGGSGTTGKVAERLGRRWMTCDLKYQEIAARRTRQRGFVFI